MEPLPDDTQKAEIHSPLQRFIFACKVQLHIARRRAQNMFVGPARHPRSAQVSALPLIAESRSALWNAEDNAGNFILTAGKVQNLRIAIKQLQGLEVPANTTFSFWKQTGKATRRKGYVRGREIREGCLVPVTGGGLCQLSNALYDVALKAGFHILERHRHSRVVRGSLAEQNRDATVKWNYIDLRFRSEHSFRIDIQMTGTELIVQLRGTRGGQAADTDFASESPAFLKDCMTCGNTLCSNHHKHGTTAGNPGETLWAGDEKWPEFYEYTKLNIQPDDYTFFPFTKRSRYSIARLCWEVGTGKATDFSFLALRRSMHIRYAAKRGRNIPSLLMKYDRLIARRLAKRIPVGVRHLVIPQNLLPFLYTYGVLAGRSYDVLMTRLPLLVLQQRLDDLAKLYPESSTAADFRVNETFAREEYQALQQARKLVAPHAETAALFPGKSVCCGWVQGPADKKTVASGGKICFPASALARKGAYEVRAWARRYGHRIHVSGNASEGPAFWKDTDVVHSPLSLENSALLVLPAYVEHQPRILLQALAAGIPVIASAACGILPQEGLYLLPEISAAAIEEKYLEIQQTYVTKRHTESRTA
ncbi:MAG: VanW family protein [Flavobacteriales bacterium]